MKRNKIFVLLGLSAISALMSLTSAYSEENSNGKAGHNGSPGEMTCAKSSCHNTFAINSGPGDVEISAPGMTDWQYVLGQTYTINVTVSQTSRSLFGFGFEALLSSGANAGTLTAGVGSHALNATVLGNVRRTITHLDEGGATPNVHTFSFTWVAPATAVPVTFYAVGNAANNNGGDSNDYIYTASQAVTALVVPTAPTITANGDTDLCNGESVTLSVNAQSDVTYNWFNNQNQLVGTGSSIVVDDQGCFEVTAINAAGSVESVNQICTTVNTVDATFSGLDSFYCLSEEPVELNATDPSGVFAGNGVTGDSFDPQQAGVGSHVIVHTVSSSGGCIDEVQQLVVVGFSASPEFELSAQTLCEGDNAITLTPSNQGGVFSGDGIENGAFNPAIGEGLYEVTYTIGDAACAQSSAQTIEVLAAPDASFFGLDDEYCSDENAQLLVPSIPAGEFEGPGMTGDSFNPSLAGEGLHLISHVVTGENGCTALATQTVEVNQAVSAEFSGLDENYCDNETPSLLVAVDEGGVFSVNAVNGLFDPSQGPGVYTVSYTNGNGSCVVVSEQITEVLASPDASFSGLLNGYCTNAEDVELLGGGAFSGDGVTNSVFSPANALIGENLVSHVVLGENGCVGTVTQPVLVFETANSDFADLQDEYCPSITQVNLNPVSAGGVFTGAGVSGEVFNPSLAGPGTHVIEHIVDLVGCFSQSSDTVFVFDEGIVNVTGLQETYCIDDANAILFADQGAALFEGPGIIENFFMPDMAGEGTHEITCTFLDENGCEGVSTLTVTVNGLPDNTILLEGNTLIAVEQDGEYTWIDCSSNQPISNALQSEYTPLVTGSYALQVNLSGCDAQSDCIEVVVIGVDERSSNEIVVYPNPAFDEVTIKMNEISDIMMIGPMGNLIAFEGGVVGTRRLDVAQWAAGTYLMRIESISGVVEKTLIVRK
jgi:hypothetical protein